MSRHPPPLMRKSSAPWDRLRPVKQDPLESMGFVSKGDSRLLEIKTQESYYHKIVARYMQFCSHYSKDLVNAFASLSPDNPSASSDPTRNPPVRRIQSSSEHAASTTEPVKPSSTPRLQANGPGSPVAADEISTILMALRKLREGLLATSHTAPSPVFSQRVHIFGIRLAILAFHPPSYHPSLQYLLSTLHTHRHPLPASELNEMTTYLILDKALREHDLVGAHELRLRSKKLFGYDNRDVKEILKAVVSDNWIAFWRIRTRVDGYVCALIHWHIATMRPTVLKAIGRSYLKCDVEWILESASNGTLQWDQLVEREAVGWIRDGQIAIIRKPKVKS